MEFSKELKRDALLILKRSPRGLTGKDLAERLRVTKQTGYSLAKEFEAEGTAFSVKESSGRGPNRSVFFAYELTLRADVLAYLRDGGSYTVEELSTGLSAERIDVLDALRSLIDAELVDYKEKETPETFERRYFWTEVEPWEVEE